MELATYYPQIKLLHMSLAAASGAGFALRGAAGLAGAAWPLARGARMASMVIDSALLAAGATLWAVLGLNPLVQHWLGVKLLAIVLYIVLGALALKRAPTRRARAACYVLALAVFAFVASVAWHHHPAGFAAAWL